MLLDPKEIGRGHSPLWQTESALKRPRQHWTGRCWDREVDAWRGR